MSLPESRWHTAAGMPSAVLQRFRKGIDGRILRPDDPEYDSARQVWNGAVDRHPALIICCSGPRDVAAVVRLAREQEACTTVRGGGHGVSGHAVGDGALVIDLTRLTSVKVDPGSQTARVEGGVTWRHFDGEAARYGLATTGGQISTTGVAGLTLGGGLGWLMRSFGATVDNLLSAEIVTAAGDQVTASERENGELFWALRGGGGNFGIATSLEFALHKVDRVLGGAIFWPVSQAIDVMGFYTEITASASRELSLMTYFVPQLNAPFIPANLRNTPMVAIAVCCHDEQQWPSVTALLRGFGQPAGDSLTPMTYPQLQALYDITAPFGMKAYWRSCYIAGLPPEALETVERFATSASSSFSQVLITHLGGALEQEPAAGTSFGHRDAAHVLEIIAKWTDGPADPHARWADEFLTAMRPFSTGGVYVNFLGDEGRERTDAAYESASLMRLRQIKAKYDPDNFFCFNQNILPAEP
jgi:FAD/FMN-containing dehydrogenase